MSTVSAKVFYFSPPPDGSPPFTTINADPRTGQPGRNWVAEEHTVEVENVRGREENYTLDTSGFQFLKKAAHHKDFLDDSGIKAEYYPESAALLKEVTGATRVELFDHTVRRHRPGDASTETNESKRQPVSQVHVDQTPESATARVFRHVPAEAEELVKKRFQIINLWRPISYPALDYPLALCDYRTVDTAKDLVPVALIYPPPQRKDEVVLIKCYDSTADKNVATFTPHTGFKDPTAPKGAPLRESVELRALVFYD
ncbi:hypothetical protein F5I97DRAFT_1922676 [Phlebopus sp. FC_14]|nr:hypothetical protein F5I97DRAFT_1922676 [Phlebopus sp. FC_14]